MHNGVTRPCLFRRTILYCSQVLYVSPFTCEACAFLKNFIRGITQNEFHKNSVRGVTKNEIVRGFRRILCLVLPLQLVRSLNLELTFWRTPKHAICSGMWKCYYYPLLCRFIEKDWLCRFPSCSALPWPPVVLNLFGTSHSFIMLANNRFLNSIYF